MAQPVAANEKAGRTKENLLQAAETLFAEQGISRASLRAITQRAGANLAAVNYHFGSKKGLVAAVFSRRLNPLNRERLEMLDAYERSASPAPCEAECVVRAFVYPVLRMVQRHRGGHEFARLIGRALSEPEEEIRSVMLEQFQEVIERFTGALTRALPHLPRDEVYWRFHFMIGAMVHTASLGFMVRQYSGGLCDPLDIDSVTHRLVTFLGAGLRHPAAGEPKVMR